VLLFFGLSLAVIKIAGGLLVISTGWHLIRGPEPQKAEQMALSPTEQNIRDVGFYPLTFPLTIGPGAISVAVTLGAGNHVPGASTLVVTLGTTAGILIAAGTIYLCYRFATRVLNSLGETGTTVVLRLSAFILLAVGVQIFCDGLAARFAIFSPGRS
jgi:multiple antibiotic resistance protein